MSNENLTEKTLADVQAGIPARDAEIETLRKENAELREQLEAIGAGGVSGKLMPGAVSAEPVAWRYKLTKHDPEWTVIREKPTGKMLIVEPLFHRSQQPVSGADETIPRHVAATLANAIYETAQKIGIANGDHTNLSVGQCLHLLDCMEGQLSGNPGQADQFRDAAQMIEPSGNSGELDEREAFEAWVQKRDGFPYARQFMNLMWESWQARAAIEAARKEPGQ